MSAVDKIRETYRRIRGRRDDGVWISLVPEDVSLAQAAVVNGKDLPLAGLTVAIKDNIDLLGLPTTAGCPEFAYEPQQDATVVRKLIAAGAIPIGKTNLDQFATGLNGTRSPYGIPRCVFNEDYVSGGSSSGSAVAVAAGLVDFSLGTDTAGSGRVPAAFNNLVGYKPTRGRWSTAGLVPACRTLDCITGFARGLSLAKRVDEVIRGFDPIDPYSRPIPEATVREGAIGILPEAEREFFGDTEYARLYSEAIAKARSLGWEVVEFDYRPFREAAALLYAGPWVAERTAAMEGFMADHADAVHPTVRAIVEGGRKFTAVETFRAQYRLAALARETEATWDRCAALMLPTAGTIYTVEQMLADPITLNSNLGRYTNFMNLLDLCGIAIPSGFRGDGIASGVTLFAPAWQDGHLFGLAEKWCAGLQSPDKQ
ncbi:MAG: allophanate hydrolase [Rhizobium sp.]|nr:MAG: allophanate hydrolase [Rhizobium sp.]